MSEPSVKEVQETSSAGSASSSRTTAAPVTGAAASRARGGAAPESSSSAGESGGDSFQPSAEEDDESPRFLSFLDQDGETGGGPGGAAPSSTRPPVERDGEGVKPLDFKSRREALDKDGDGEVTRQDLEVGKEAFGKMDADGDGKLSAKEVRADFHRQNSFEGLDRDHDGRLSAEEMERLERFDASAYDRNRDGTVDSREFVDARRAEIRAARRERIGQRLAGLGDDEARKMVEKFDADDDGKVTVEEVLAGRREARETERADRAADMFKALAGDGKEISVADHKRYRGYDADGNGKVSRKEFREGQAADYRGLREDLYVDGAADPAARKRLGIDAAGQVVPGTDSRPVDVGNLKNLTWEKATALVKAQGGKLFQNGEPTVLAIRTANAGTPNYEDHFVVLKPNGEMKTFAATTRPSATIQSGWDPSMVVAGNYRLTPRPPDGKWDNAFIFHTAGGSDTVPAARDRNANGVYDPSEIANPQGDNEIRLHPGNSNGLTSSAGCFNVQDYEAFLEFLGGRNQSFNMTLVDG